MKRINVACGLLTHAIFAQDVHDNVVVNDSTCDVTRMAIEAVRDYMVDEATKGNGSVGYSWKRKDGTTVKLMCVIDDNNNHDEGERHE